jgi:hypothetical protein
VLLAPVLTLACGCVTLEQTGCKASAPPTGVPCQVVATWQPQVKFAADPVHGGVQAPGLAGRLYLFGPEVGYPMAGDGSVVVDLYDATCATGGPPVMIEEWQLDSATLKKLLKRDAIGWGYTMFLPWGSFRPDIARVSLRVRYQPLQGAPLFAESAAMTLNHEGESGPVVTQAAKR